MLKSVRFWVLVLFAFKLKDAFTEPVFQSLDWKPGAPGTDPDNADLQKPTYYFFEVVG